MRLQSQRALRRSIGRWIPVVVPGTAAVPHPAVPHSRAPRPGSVARLLLLLGMTFTATATRPAAAQAPAADGCNCSNSSSAGPVTGPDSTAARLNDRDRRAWWLAALLVPFVGSPLLAGDGAPGAMMPSTGPGRPGTIGSATATAGGYRVASAAGREAALPPLGGVSADAPNRSRVPARELDAASAPGPAALYALAAPATATNRPTVLLAGLTLLLLGVGLRQAQRRAEARRAAALAAQAARPAPSTPRVLFTPSHTPAAPAFSPSDLWRAPAASGALVVAGLCCFAAVGFGFARGAVAAWEVRSNWAEPTADEAVVAPGGLEIAAVGRLEIPVIGLSRLVGEGVDGRTLAGGPGHIPETVAPGLANLSVISAHRDLDFRHLDAVAVGDTVVTTTRTRRTVWRVVERVVVDKDSAALVPTAGRARLALTTCWPIRYLGPAPERLLVFAEPVRTGPAPPEPVRVAGI